MTKCLKPVKQPHEVLLSNDKPIDWKNPPKVATLCRWSKRDYLGRVITASFYTLCHMNRLNNLALKRFGKEITVYQRPYNSSVPASKGTHDYDAVWDLWIPGVDPWAQQSFFRANGLAGWMRHPPSFGWHYHGFTLPPEEGVDVNDNFKMFGLKVGVYVDGGWCTYGRKVATSQIWDYYNKAFGLANKHVPNSDKSWHPKDTERGIKGTIFNHKKYIKRRANICEDGK